ncbi:hypothetical protein F5887DRAFT_998299 [Amanita rubescens]|nr:hypothetical protein F5887DRAFT_998299 [Amanita rubescens]
MLAYFIAFCVLLAGRVSATFNVTLGNQVLFAGDILAIPSSAVTTACNDACTAADTALQNCNNDPTCLCQTSTVSMLLTCEQCMYNYLIANFEAAPDPRAGSQPVLTGYGAACVGANQVLPASATLLTLAPGWNGPQSSVLSTGATAIVVTLGGMLGFGALYLLSHM